MTLWNLGGLSDEQLLQGARDLVRDKGRTDARLVAHLVEVEARRLHLAAACPSLFEYCRRRLGLSENEAFHRITAARLAGRFPLLFELLESRALTLSATCLLRDYLTPENHRALLGAASHKSKREIEVLLAQRFPGAPQAASLRKLPSHKVQPLCTPPTAFTSACPPNSTHASTAASHPPSADAPARPPEPLFRLKLDVSARLKAKLEAATALMSHSNPRGELELAIERGLDLLLAQLEKERWGKTERPRRAKEARGASVLTLPGKVHDTGIAQGQGVREAERGQGDAVCKGAASRRTTSRKHIAHEVRRAVVERDRACCSYVSPDGERCSAHSFLQLHHVEPWARGGPDTAENLQLVCAAHNHFFAEQDFGPSARSFLCLAK